MASLEQFITDQSQKPLADRTYLSREAFRDRYGANCGDLDRIEQYASLHDLTVLHRNASQRMIVVRGHLGALLRAFPATVNLYQHRSGPYRGRTGKIQVPPELEGLITGIFGFDTRPKRRHGRRKRVSPHAGPGGPNGQSPAYFARRYNFPQQYQGEMLDGRGQTIGIIELGGSYQPSVLQSYFSQLGVAMPSILPVSVFGVGPSSKPKNDDGEVMLDIEVAGIAAPGAKQVVYFAPNDDSGLIAALSAAVHDTERDPSVISVSWGNPEPSDSDGDEQERQELTAYSEIFKDAASLGITVCVASGDHGTADLAADTWDGAFHVEHPAVDPYVLACGGTQIDDSNQDVVWNDGMPFDTGSGDGGGWASGGGISKRFTDVPQYQLAVNHVRSLDGGTAGRGIPDISMSAVGYFERVDSATYASGGTSAVAPLMAALICLLNQAKKKRVGFLNPFLYEKATLGAVHDVTKGTNAIAGTLAGYTAGPGWDPCSGLGTPDGEAILNLL